VTINGVWIGEWIYWPLMPHRLEIEVITAPTLISTIHKSKQHPLRLRGCGDFTSRSLATASNSIDYSASRPQVLPSPTSVRIRLPATPASCHLWSQSQSYFTTGGLPPINPSWHQPLETHDQYYFVSEHLRL
jgi:hypothetical protein